VALRKDFREATWVVPRELQMQSRPVYWAGFFGYWHFDLTPKRKGKYYEDERSTDSLQKPSP